MQEPFTLEQPNKPSPLVLDSPHSGSHYPDKSRITSDARTLKLTEDTYVDNLFADAPQLGAAFLCANYHRAFIDLNRPADDIDPRVLSSAWPEEEYGPIAPTQHSDHGIGLIWRIIKNGQTLNRNLLSPKEIRQRIDTVYTPYHKALDAAVDKAQETFGASWHINCHSMPKSGAYARQALGTMGVNRSPVEFCIGNLDGRTAGKEFTNVIRDFLEDKGYIVSINDPYAGVEILKRQGDPLRGRHSIQLEINRALYMNETTGEKTENYSALKSDLSDLVEHTLEYTYSECMPRTAE